MAYFEDLSAGRYHRGALDSENWSAPVRYVGWLEHPHSFTTGAVDDRVVDRLLYLHQRFRDHTDGFRGYHSCSFCAHEGREEALLISSHINLFVPGDQEVFIAPGRVDHYITEHGYRPPQAFLDAVAVCAAPVTDEFLTQLEHANSGKPIDFDRGFDRERLGAKYTDIPPLECSADHCRREEKRLVALGYEQALSPEAFGALVDRLSDSHREDALLRSYRASVALSTDETVRVRVQARSPFEARAAISDAYPHGSVRDCLFWDEDRPARRRIDVEPETVSIPAMPHSEATLELIIAIALDDYASPFQRYETACKYIRESLTAEYFDVGDVRPFRGPLYIGEDSYEVVVNARTQLEAQVAAIAHFGDRYRFHPYPDRGPWWSTKERLDDDLPSSDPDDVVDILMPPVSDETFEQIFAASLRRDRWESTPERLAERRQRLADRYFPTEPTEMHGYVVANGERTFVRLMTKNKWEARLALWREFGEFAPMSLWRL